MHLFLLLGRINMESTQKPPRRFQRDGYFEPVEALHRHENSALPTILSFFLWDGSKGFSRFSGLNIHKTKRDSGEPESLF